MTATKKKLAKDLKVGNKFKVPAETATILSIKKIDAKIPSMTKGLLIYECQMNSGPWKGSKAEFVISEDEKMEYIRNKRWYHSILEYLPSLAPYAVLGSIPLGLYVTSLYV